MNKVFNQVIAQKYGAHTAVILRHLVAIIKDSMILHDGNVWVSSSRKHIQSKLSFLNKNQIGYVFRKLEKTGLVLSECRNPHPYDRTRWYAITEKGYRELLAAETDERAKSLIRSIMQNCTMQDAKLHIATCEIAPCKMQNQTTHTINNNIYNKYVCDVEVNAREVISENTTHTPEESDFFSAAKSQNPATANEITNFFSEYQRNELQGLCDANREEKTKRLRNECLQDESIRKLFTERLSAYCVEYEELLDECISWNANRDRPRHVDRHMFAQWIRTTNPAMKGWAKRSDKQAPASVSCPFTEEELELMQARKAELKRPGLLILRSDMQREKADRLLEESGSYQGLTVNHRTVSSMPVSIKSLLGMRNSAANSGVVSG